MKLASEHGADTPEEIDAEYTTPFIPYRIELDTIEMERGKCFILQSSGSVRAREFKLCLCDHFSTSKFELASAHGQGESDKLTFSDAYGN